MARQSQCILWSFCRVVKFDTPKDKHYDFDTTKGVRRIIMNLGKIDDPASLGRNLQGELSSFHDVNQDSRVLAEIIIRADKTVHLRATIADEDEEVQAHHFTSVCDPL